MNPWDKLAEMFGGGGDAPKYIADNVLLAFPPMLDLVCETFPKVRGLQAMDFGCGSGRFSKKLHALGCQVTALDNSAAMVQQAKKYLPEDVKISAGSLEDLQAAGEKFDVIAANMVFQFIQQIDLTLRGLDRLMKPSGLLIFSVFEPKFVAALLAAEMVFTQFDSAEFPRQGMMELVKGARVPVFVREAEEYAGLLLGLGYKKVLETRPPFTPEFLKKHPVPFPTAESEFLILGFRKK